MNTSLNRRDVVKGGALAAAALARPALLAAEKPAKTVKPAAPSAEKLGWELACQLYSFRGMSCYEALPKIASLGVRLIEPCFFLRLDKARPKLQTGPNLPPAVRKEWKKRLDDMGIQVANVYANLTGNADDCRRQFEFAKEMGGRTFVAEPPAEAFDTIEKFCDEYKIDLAVHNHPKSPASKYWKPENVLAVCKGRSKRIGGCCDTGHWVRSSLDPIACLKQMKGRIVSMHLKDVVEVGNPAARDVPLGQGKAKYTQVLRELHAQGFRGVLSIEYEHQSPKLLDEIAACVAFVEKTARAIQGA